MKGVAEKVKRPLRPRPEHILALFFSVLAFGFALGIALAANGARRDRQAQLNEVNARIATTLSWRSIAPRMIARMIEDRAAMSEACEAQKNPNAAVMRLFSRLSDPRFEVVAASTQITAAPSPTPLGAAATASEYQTTVTLRGGFIAIVRDLAQLETDPLAVQVGKFAVERASQSASQPGSAPNSVVQTVVPLTIVVPPAPLCSADIPHP